LRVAEKKGDFAEMTERILAFVNRLLQFQTTRPFEKHENDLEVEKWLDECRAVWEEDKKNAAPRARSIGESKDDFRERRDEILMENLTAGWLALYFLGVPFIEPWERVRRLADERGGFPSGACVTKYLGDVYRTARQQMFGECDGTIPEKQDEFELLVLSYAPLALLDGLLDFTDGNLTPCAVHQLGWCYALLQLRLYIKGGFPIKYFVPLESLNNNLCKLSNSEQKKCQDIIRGIKPWLNIVFPETGDERQSVTLLRTSLGTLGMPTCVLGHRIGMCVLDTSHYPTPFSGNQIAGDLLASYRKKLKNIQPSRVDNLKIWTKADFRKNLHAYKD
jgi:hypothetical protein